MLQKPKQKPKKTGFKFKRPHRTVDQGEAKRVRDALSVLSSECSYQEWIDIGMAIHSWDGGETGFGLWKDWSSQATEKTYAGEDGCRKHWHSFRRREHGIRLGTLFGMARAELDTQDSTHQPKRRRVPVIDVSDWLATAPSPIAPVIEGIIGSGDKLAIIGPSKARKSFFCLQLGLALASGKKLLAWRTRKHRVLMVQCEIRDEHYHRRVRRVAAAMGVSPENLEMLVFNGRGTAVDVDRIHWLAQICKAAVILIDPLYKVMSGDENSQRDMADFLAGLDNMAETTGAAVVYVHHDAKGRAGDRDSRDRGSGSGVLGRDYDACITLTPHADEPDAVVIETLLRNYPPQGAITATWDGCFRDAPDLLPLPETSRTAKAKRNRGPGIDELCEKALSVLADRTMRMGDFRSELHGALPVGEKRIRDVVNRLTGAGKITKTRERTQGGGILVSKVRQGLADSAIAEPADPTKPGQVRARHPLYKGAVPNLSLPPSKDSEPDGPIPDWLAEEGGEQ